MTFTRKQIQIAYIRVCKDSNFTMEWHAVMGLVSSVLHIHPVDIWAAFSDLATMIKIADGTHSCLKEENYEKAYGSITFNDGNSLDASQSQ